MTENQSKQINESFIRAIKHSQEMDNEPRAGRIERIILKNFLCHSHLEVKLNNINVIIGLNGSGKSAIITGLIVGLGGSAVTTNRGKNLKSFIKYGKNNASIEIVLINEGSTAYKTSIYGKRITIIRTFSLNSSSYKIKGENGHIVTTKLKELNNILFYLNIQINNPICILTQEASKNFLCSNDPKEKYQLFEKALQMDVMINELKTVEININDINQLIYTKNEQFNLVEKHLNKMKIKIEGYKTQYELQKSVQLLNIEIVWAIVNNIINELELDRKNINDNQQKLQEINAKNLQNEINDIIKMIRNLEQETVKIKDLNSIQISKKNDLNLINDQLQQQYDNENRKKALHESYIDDKTIEINNIQKEIDNYNENCRIIEEERYKHAEQIKQLKENIKNIDDYLQTSRNDIFQLLSDKNFKENILNQNINDLIKINKQINDEERNLNVLETSKDNLLIYGNDMPRFKKIIQQNKNKFHCLPIGPIGQYIKIKQKKWAVAVEGFLKYSLLSAFIVDNQHDNKILRDIFNKYTTNQNTPNIICTKFTDTKFDVRNNLVQSPNDCDSIYNIIECDNNVVLNTIVDQCSIENILLIPSNNRAIELLSDKRYVPKGCLQGITIEGDVFYPDPNYRSYGSTYKQAKYLQVNMEQYKNQIIHSLNKLKETKEKLINDQIILKNDLNNTINNHSILKGKVNNITIQKQNLTRQFDEIKSKCAPEIVSCEFLQTEKDELIKMIDDKRKQLNQIIDDLVKLQDTLNDNQYKINEINEFINQYNQRMEQINDKIHELNVKKIELIKSSEIEEKYKNDLNSKINQLEISIKQKEINLQDKINDACKVGEKPDIVRSMVIVSAELNNKMKALQKIEKDLVNGDEFIKNYNDLQLKQNNNSKLLKQLKENINLLNVAYKDLKKVFKITHKNFILYSRDMFRNFMQLRQFEGDIKFDEVNKSLELVVKPHQGIQNATSSSNLSGGERSFSTVGFLYSLWQCMESPFFFMDEFDVFMDKFNRTKVLDLLLDHAKSRPYLQYIFLTPQDVSHLVGKKHEDVNILKLSDPR